MDASAAWTVIRLAIAILAISSLALLFYDVLRGATKAKLVRDAALVLVFTITSTLIGVRPPEPPPASVGASSLQ